MDASRRASGLCPIFVRTTVRANPRGADSRTKIAVRVAAAGDTTSPLPLPLPMTPASAKVRFTSNWQSKRPVLPVDSQSLRSHRPPFIL